MVYQLGLNTELGKKSEAYFDMNLARVELTDQFEGTIFGNQDRDYSWQLIAQFMNAQKVLQRENDVESSSLQSKFQYSIFFRLSGRLDTLELSPAVSKQILLVEAGGLLFLANFCVGILLKPYSDFCLQKDLLNKTFKMDISDKDKYTKRDVHPASVEYN